MRVDGSSRPTQSVSSEGATETARTETRTENNVVKEESSRAEGFDSTSSFEEDNGGAVHRERLQPPPPPPPPPEEKEEEPAPLPLRDLKRGDTGPDVKAVQDALVKLGYLTEEQVATGPGQFGPKTEAALERFQAEHGLTASGDYAGRTREALGKALTEAKSSGGARRPAMSAEDAFITQFTSEYNPTGPRGSTNCGPASLAMSLAYTGHMPAGLTKEQQVDYARALMSPRRESEFTYVKASDGTRVPQLDRDRELTGGTMVSDGVKGAGLDARYGQGWEELDRQLAAGNPVVANGRTNAAWREQFPERMGSGDIGHLNAILGKTSDGKYLVADPLHTGGPVAMTREQLGVFFSPTRGQPSFTALQGASTNPAADAGARAGGSVGAAVAKRLEDAARDVPAPKPEPFLPNPGVSTVGGSGTDVKTRAAQDAKALEATLQTSLEQGARQFERLIASNPDPVYQEAFVRAAEPSLAKMGQLFAGVSPETNRKLHPPGAQKPPDLNDRKVLEKLANEETRIEHETYYALARATEHLKDPTAGRVGKAFTRDAPPTLVNLSLTSAVRTSLNFGLGSRLAFDIERSLSREEVIPPGSTAPSYGTAQAALHQTLWSTLDGIRGQFATAADKAQLHQQRLTELLSGPAAVLSPEQQKAFIDTYLRQGSVQQDLAEHERLGKLLSTAAPDGVPVGSDDARVKALARELPRLAETKGGAEYLAAQLTAKAEDKPLFLDVVGALKDGKDFDEKLALALVKSAGTVALISAGDKSPAEARKVFDGLARYADVFGMKSSDMKSYFRLLRDIKPGSTDAQVLETTKSLKALLTDQETGLPFAPDSPRGQALRTLGMLVTTTAFVGDATGWSQADLASRLKVVGDGLSVTGDGATVITSVLGNTARWSSAVSAFGKVSALGAVLGAAGDAMQSLQFLRKGDGWKFASSGAQALGGALMAGASLFGMAPGFQILGAALFLGGLGLKYLDPADARLREEQVRLLTASGMAPGLAKGLIHLGPDLLDSRLVQGAGMSPEQVQTFLTAHPDVAQDALHLDSLAQAASAMKMKGAHFQEFIERLAKAHGVDMATLGREVHTLFFGHPPSGGAGGGEQYRSQGDEFRAWVQQRTPDVAAWAKQHESP
ncbi:peptidoglycan-binding protein [Myxococcus faecalis]|uniref:peptidoglycan-binding protein n=1 Tax=Myxococcus faecalis TaxID=3115646 RepID=UPI003CF60F63